MQINVNQLVQCELTESGREVYQVYLDQFSNLQGAPQNPSNTLALPLWEFAHIFGNAMFDGQNAAPFTANNEIRLVDASPVQTLITQLRILRKWGMATVFSPLAPASGHIQQSWCIKAAAQLLGHDLADLESLPWQKLFAAQEMSGLQGLDVRQIEGLEPADITAFQGVLEAAELLLEMVAGMTREQAVLAR